ncbi:MAG TPA: hypothetical protein PKL97_07075 [Candidatus Omnitrophota bacterium]|nr:hypothetical protein [Candidatus Omnitrophota bacterium]
MKIYVKSTSGEYWKIKKFLNRLAWMFYHGKGDVLSLQIMKGMFLSLEGTFFRGGESEGKIRRVFSILEDKSSGPDARREGLSLLKSLCLFYGVGSIHFPVRHETVGGAEPVSCCG